MAASDRREPAGAVMLSGGPREPPGPGGWDPPGPGAPGRFFCKIGSCLNFLCCCWFLKDCFVGPLSGLSPPGPPGRPDPALEARVGTEAVPGPLSPPGPPGRPDPVLEARVGTEAVPPYRVSERPATAQECYSPCGSLFA